MKARILETLSDDAPPMELSPPHRALWWLKKGGLTTGPEWERAHELCQASEGEPAHDAVHGLAHWIEGDDGNADYWYRRAGQRRGGSVADEWERLATTLPGFA